MTVGAAQRARLILVRHGQSEGNANRRFSHGPDIDLTEAGIEQARAAGAAIAQAFRPSRIVASSYHRARHTAELIAAEVGYEGPIRIEPDLRERSIGELAGQPYSAMVKHPQYVGAFFFEWRPGGGESLVDVRQRAGAVCDRLLLDYPGEDVVVVSHGGVMLALCAHIRGVWGSRQVAGNCEILVVTPAPTGGLVLSALEADREMLTPGPEAPAGG